MPKRRCRAASASISPARADSGLEARARRRGQLLPGNRGPGQTTAQEKMPKYAKKEARKQLRRLEMMHPDASEATIVRTYLSGFWICPGRKPLRICLICQWPPRCLTKITTAWTASVSASLNIWRCASSTPIPSGPIIRFAGPPGARQDPFGQAIAKAMGRKFYRLSLGGMRDEAEILRLSPHLHRRHARPHLARPQERVVTIRCS